MVLHLISGLGVGGAERLLLWAARHHDRDRFPMGIVSLMSGGELAEDIRATRVPMVELGQKRGRFSLSAFHRLFAEIRRFQPLILQGHMFHSNILAGLGRGALPPGGKVINTIHIEWEPWPRRVLYTATAPFVDGYITFSPEAERIFTRTGPWKRPVRHIPYGIEIGDRTRTDKAALRTRLGLPEQGPLWISVGRLTRQKAYGDLVEAFSLLESRNASAHLVIAGEGEDRGALEKKISDRKLGERVLLLGTRRDVPDLLAASDFFVLSSRWEGGPLVVLEAMAAGLPVVATRVGDVERMVDHGETGLIVNTGSVRALAGAMSRLMEMDQKITRMGAAGRQRLEKYYDYRRMQNEMENFYAQLAGGADRGVH